MYTKSTKYQFAEQLGIIYKDIKYDDKLTQVNSYLDGQLPTFISTAPQILGIQRNKNLIDYRIFAFGNVLCDYEPFYKFEKNNYSIDNEVEAEEVDSLESSVEIKGYKFKTGGFDVDYYNDIVIPQSSKMVTNGIQEGVVKLDMLEAAKWNKDNPPLIALKDNKLIRIDPDDISEFIEPAFQYKSKREVDVKLFPRKIVLEENREYKYLGANPLPLEYTKTTTLSGDMYPSKTKYRVLAVTQDLNLVDVIIVNYDTTEADPPPTTIDGIQYMDLADNFGDVPIIEMSEMTRMHYASEWINGVTFFRNLNTEKSRSEDVISAQLIYNNQIQMREVIYPCQKGLGS